MRVPVFAGDWACEIELRHTGVICIPWRQRSWSCGVIKSWISDAHCPCQWIYEYGKFYTTMIYMCFSRSVCFSMGSPAWWRFTLSSSGSTLVSRWRDAPLVREFQMWRSRCKQIDLHWFQGVKCVSVECARPYSEKNSIVYQVRLFSTANI